MFRALRLLLLTVLLGIASAQNVQPKVSITRWPQDRASAISLTFDDETVPTSTMVDLF